MGIAQALLGDPPFLIFDEPTVGLDPEERIHFRNLFSRTAQDRLVLLSTHIIEDVQSVCDRLVVIDHGQILFTGTPEQLIQAAEGHVGVFWEREAAQEQGLHITARVNTSQGVRCRAVADTLPAYVQADGALSGGRLPLSHLTGGGTMKAPASVPPGAGTASAQPPDLAHRSSDRASPPQWDSSSTSRPLPAPCSPCTWPIRPWPEGRAGGILFGLLTVYELDRAGRSRVEVLTNAVVSPLSRGAGAPAGPAGGSRTGAGSSPCWCGFPSAVG